MELNTRHFGLIEINDDSIIDFPEGVLGFEDVKRFVLLGKPEADMPFQWLQGVDDTNLAFVVIDPRLLRTDYAVDIPDEEVEVLDIKDVNNVMIYSIVVVPEDISKMTANFKAPVLINAENKKGKQVVMASDDYSVRHYIMEELQRMGG